jgi:hypothetical protein
MADDPNAMLAALTGAPPLPPRKPAEFQAPEGAYEDPDTDAAEQDMIADQMGSRGNEDGLTQEQLQDLIAKKGDLREHLESFFNPSLAPIAKPRSVVDTGNTGEPDAFTGKLIDRRRPFGGDVNTPQANRFFINRPNPNELVARMDQADDEGRVMDNVMGRNTGTLMTPGLSPDPKDVALRQLVASRMGSDRPERPPPQPTGVMSFLGRLMGR